MALMTHVIEHIDDPDTILRQLQKVAKRLIVEGGPHVSGSFVNAGLVDEVSVLILPLTLIASIWGMNTAVPGEQSIVAFWVIIGVM